MNSDQQKQFKAIKERYQGPLVLDQLFADHMALIKLLEEIPTSIVLTDDQAVEIVGILRDLVVENLDFVDHDEMESCVDIVEAIGAQFPSDTHDFRIIEDYLGSMKAMQESLDEIDNDGEEIE